MTNLQTLKYKILPELNLIIDVWYGAMTFDKILASKLEQVKDPKWNQGYNNISDIRNAVFSLKMEEAKKIIEYIRADTRWQFKRRTAYITKNPNQVVFQKFIEMAKSKEIPNEIESFSTLQAALSWLRIDDSEFKKIDHVIADLNAAEYKA